MKKLLILGGSSSSIDFVKTAKKMGIYTIVTDWNNVTDSPVKLDADEYWDVSIMDYDKLVDLSRKSGVDGIIPCMRDSYLTPYRILCDKLGLPCYLNKSTEEISINKLKFKAACTEYGIPVAKRYNININDNLSLATLPYPVVVKPADGSGSRGFKICNNIDDVRIAYPVAEKISTTGQVIVEDYIPYDATIIHYTLVNGKCYYSGISDKISCRFESSGSSVMGLQVFPSLGEKAYLETLNDKAINMFESLGFENGPVWIEAFFDGKDKFVFNEMGYRYGGSSTFYPVEWMFGFSQMEMLLNFAVGNETGHFIPVRNNSKQKYCILPIHSKPGRIAEIRGMEDVLSRGDVYAYAPKYHSGQEIKDWGTAQQVFGYLHVLFSDKEGLNDTITEVLTQLKAYDEKGNNLLFTLFNLDNLKKLSI